jgi:hypothetical protein
MKIKTLFREFFKSRAHTQAEPQYYRQTRPEPAPRADLEKLAVERLASLGTKRSLGLAMEIQHGIDRRTDDLH